MLARSAVEPLCNGPDWALAHAEAFGSGDALFGWTLRHDGEPVAVLSFRAEDGRSSLPRVMLGADGSFDSEYLDLCAARGYEGAVLERALALLAERGGFRALLLSYVAGESATLARLAERGTPRNEIEVHCPIAELGEDYGAFVAARKKRVREKIRQAVRRSEKGGATFAVYDRAAGEGELDGWLDELFALHQKRWEAAGEPGSFHGERRDFYARLARWLEREGRLVFVRLERDGRGVAYQFGARFGERLYALQEGFDPELGRERPATALRALSIERLIAEGVRVYDFLAGEGQHKAEWGTGTRPCRSVAVGIGLRGRLSYRLRALLGRSR